MLIASAGSVHLALASWQTLLCHLCEGLRAAGEREPLESLGQLKALYEREDRDAFLSVVSEELTSSFARRLIQFGELIDAAVARLVTEVGDSCSARPLDYRSVGSFQTVLLFLGIAYLAPCTNVNGELWKTGTTLQQAVD